MYDGETNQKLFLPMVAVGNYHSKITLTMGLSTYGKEEPVSSQGHKANTQQIDGSIMLDNVADHHPMVMLFSM